MGRVYLVASGQDGLLGQMAARAMRDIGKTSPRVAVSYAPVEGDERGLRFMSERMPRLFPGATLEAIERDRSVVDRADLVFVSGGDATLYLRSRPSASCIPQQSVDSLSLEIEVRLERAADRFARAGEERADLEHMRGLQFTREREQQRLRLGRELRTAGRLLREPPRGGGKHRVADDCRNRVRRPVRLDGGIGNRLNGPHAGGKPA